MSDVGNPREIEQLSGRPVGMNRAEFSCAAASRPEGCGHLPVESLIPLARGLQSPDQTIRGRRLACPTAGRVRRCQCRSSRIPVWGQSAPPDPISQVPGSCLGFFAADRPPVVRVITL